MAFAGAASAQLVISQVYGGGGGGTAGIPWKYDFVELFNQGATPAPLAGYSLQYGSAAGLVGPTASPNQLVVLSGTVPARGYFLVQLGSAGTVGSDLPTPDLVSANIAASATSGKIALVSSTTPLNVANPVGNAALVDFVGYGTANASETSPVGALTNATSAIRKLSGCTETNNNLSDFVVAPPKPRNSACGLNVCAGGVSETWIDTVGAAAAVDGSLGANEYGAGNAYVFRGDGTDFSGMIGWSPTAARGVYFSSDLAGVNIGLNFGTDISADNTAVILLDTRSGGVPSATLIPFNNGDATQRSIGRALQCGMPSGFEADYAIGINRFGVFVFGVAANGMIFVNSATTAGSGTSFATTREARIPYSALVDFTAGSPIDFVVTLNNGAAGPNTFMSNESVPPSAGLNSNASPGNSGGSFSNFNRFITFCPAPTITSQPAASTTVCAGEPFTLSVGAGGSGLSYQWRKGAMTIMGATGSSYSVTMAAPADAGSYDCVITNACGAVTTTAAVVTVGAGTTITTQPIGQPVCAGSGLVLSVGAAGGGTLSYQWQWRESGEPGFRSAVVGPNLNGSGVPRFVREIAIDELNIDIREMTTGLDVEYRCVVTGSCGSATSDGAVITVIDAPSIDTQPLSQTICSSGNAVFTAAASGAGPLTYSWRVTDPQSGVPLVVVDGLNLNPLGTSLFVAAGATTPALSLSSPGGDGVWNFHVWNEIRVRAANSCGSRDSMPASLTICRPDVNCSGAVTVQDIFDFLSTYFSNGPGADFNNSGIVSVQDIFDFLAAYFAGCP